MAINLSELYCLWLSGIMFSSFTDQEVLHISQGTGKVNFFNS